MSYRQSLTTSAKENGIYTPFGDTLANVPSFSQISRDLEEFLQKEIRSALVNNIMHNSYVLCVYCSKHLF